MELGRLWVSDIKRVSLALTIVCLFGGSAHAVAQQAPLPDRARVLTAARDVMTQARYATLVTIGEDGQPQARVVDPAAPEADLSVWIATNPASRKVTQLRKDARATLLYFDRARESYVTLLGTASLVTDPAEKARHWQARWAPHYPDGPRAASHLQIRFTPGILEIVSGPHKLEGDPKTWRPVVLELKQGK